MLVGFNVALDTYWSMMTADDSSREAQYKFTVQSKLVRKKMCKPVHTDPTDIFVSYEK